MPGWYKLYIAGIHVKGQCDLMLLACIHVTRARYIRGCVRVCAFSPRACAFRLSLRSLGLQQNVTAIACHGLPWCYVGHIGSKRTAPQSRPLTPTDRQPFALCRSTNRTLLGSPSCTPCCRIPIKRRPRRKPEAPARTLTIQSDAS